MANDLWTMVEDAVVEALKQELEDQVNTLATYQGDWLTHCTGNIGVSRRFWCSSDRAGGSRSPFRPMT